MTRLRNIIDTWNMMEKFGIDNYTFNNRVIEISDADFQKMLDGAKNKNYIRNLLASNGNMYGRGDF